MPVFSLIIPCYNERGAIEETVRRIRAALPRRETYRLIIVDDGSTDGTGEVLDRLATDDPTMAVLRNEENRGYGAAIKSGLRSADTELIAIVDADGTYPIERIPELVRACEDCDMVVGARVGDGVEYSSVRKIPKTFLAAYVSWIARTRIPDFNSGLRVFRRSLALKFFNLLPDGFSLTTTMTLAMHTTFLRVRYVPIEYKRRIGRSKIRPIRDTAQFFQLIMRTGMYFAPLRVLAPFALLLLAFGLVSFGVDVFVYSNLTDKTILLLLSAFNTGALGLLGDMIAKRLLD